MNIYQKTKEFGKKILLVSGLVATLYGCNQDPNKEKFDSWFNDLSVIKKEQLFTEEGVNSYFNAFPCDSGRRDLIVYGVTKEGLGDKINQEFVENTYQRTCDNHKKEDLERMKNLNERKIWFDNYKINKKVFNTLPKNFDEDTKKLLSLLFNYESEVKELCSGSDFECSTFALKNKEIYELRRLRNNYNHIYQPVYYRGREDPKVLSATIHTASEKKWVLDDEIYNILWGRVTERICSLTKCAYEPTMGPTDRTHYCSDDLWDLERDFENMQHVRKNAKKNVKSFVVPKYYYTQEQHSF